MTWFRLQYIIIIIISNRSVFEFSEIICASQELGTTKVSGYNHGRIVCDITDRKKGLDRTSYCSLPGLILKPAIFDLRHIGGSPQ